LGPFRYGAFRRAIGGRVVSAAGTWMQTVAAGWLILDLTHSAAAVGVLTACSRGPAIFLSTYGGTLADRFDPRRVTIALYGFQILPALALAVLAWAETPSPFEIYALTLVIGIAGALASPGLQKAVTGTVPGAFEKRAAAITSASFNVARLVAPAAGGGLLAVAGPGPCFAVNAGSFGIVAALVATLPRHAGKAPGTPAGIRSAARLVRSNPLLRTVFPLVLVFSLLVAPVQELAPGLAHRYGGGAHLLGFLLSALAAGGLIAIPARFALARRGVSSPDTLGGSMIFSAAALLILAASPNFALAALAMVLCGIGLDVAYIVGLTDAQFADKRRSGLLTGVFFAATVGGLTFGALLVGGLFDLLGIGPALVVCATIVALVGVWTIGARRVQHSVEKLITSRLRHTT
jgi:predicted MFS family arabinose efflux permease